MTGVPHRVIGRTDPPVGSGRDAVGLSIELPEAEFGTGLRYRMYSDTGGTRNFDSG